MSAAEHHPSPLGDQDEHITTSTAERLVYMANQMAKFFASQKHDTAVAGLADHIVKFWDPRMKAMIGEHMAAGGAGLDPLAKEALTVVGERVRAKASR
jgi:formate dehydrogenase subunit delta